MDVVYILGTGSKWQNNEIRYSLRSLQNIKHDRVFVIGERPEWLEGIIHVPAGDIFGSQKQKNALHKLSVALKTDVSDDFILMNDDFFILKPTVVRYAYKGTLQESLTGRAGGLYREALKNTIARFPAGFDYSLHIPFIYNKHKLAETIATCDDKPVLLRALYGNMHQVGGCQMDDVKLNTLRDFNLGLALGLGDYVSSSDELVTRDLSFRHWLQERFPNPSKYEYKQ